MTCANELGMTMRMPSGDNRREGAIDGASGTIFGPELGAGKPFTVFMTSSDIVDAELKASWLGANGIPVIFAGALTATIFGTMMPVAKVIVLIPEDRFADANQLLEILAVGDNLSMLPYGEEE